RRCASRRSTASLRKGHWIWETPDPRRRRPRFAENRDGSSTCSFRPVFHRHAPRPHGYLLPEATTWQSRPLGPFLARWKAAELGPPESRDAIRSRGAGSLEELR